MGMIMIRCPGTGKAIPTGIEADSERFRSSAVFFSRTYCQICATSHEWFAREAWVYDSARGESRRGQPSHAGAA
jgi:hypothetical protein